MFTAPLALPLYAAAFEAAGKLHNLEGFASHHGPDFYGLPRNTVSLRCCRALLLRPVRCYWGCLWSLLGLAAGVAGVVRPCCSGRCMHCPMKGAYFPAALASLPLTNGI